MAKSDSASSSLSSASKAASLSASSASSIASKSLASASAKASAAATDAYQKHGSTGMTLLTAVAIVVTVFAVIIGGIYYSGYADDVGMWYAKKFYAAKAKAEMAAMEKMGEGKANDFLKGQLKKNPLMGEEELEKFSPGLGKEASAEGLGGVSSKLGGLGSGLGGGIPKF